MKFLPALLFSALLASFSAKAVEITITCGPSGGDVEFCLKHAQAWAAKTGHTIKNFSPPTSATEKLALYRQLFAAKSGDIDVVQIDTVWPGLLKDHLTDLKPYSKGIEPSTSLPSWPTTRSTANFWACLGTPMQACSITVPIS